MNRTERSVDLERAGKMKNVSVHRNCQSFSLIKKKQQLKHREGRRSRGDERSKVGAEGRLAGRGGCRCGFTSRVVIS